MLAATHVRTFCLLSPIRSLKTEIDMTIIDLFLYTGEICLLVLQVEQTEGTSEQDAEEDIWT